MAMNSLAWLYQRGEFAALSSTCRSATKTLMHFSSIVLPAHTPVLHVRVVAREHLSLVPYHAVVCDFGSLPLVSFVVISKGMKLVPEMLESLESGEV